MLKIPTLSPLFNSAAEVLHEQATQEFWRDLRNSPHEAQAEKLLRRFSGDIDPSFLGFLGQYWMLAQLLPLDRTIYDIGCGYAFQSWFFHGHKSYIGIDLNPVDDRMTFPHTIHIQADACEWLARDPNPGIVDPHFAICSYVPPWGKGNIEAVVRAHFRHCFVYYP